MQHKAGYLNIKQASELVGVHTDTIRRLIKNNKDTKNVIRGKGEKAPYYLNEQWLKNIYDLNEPYTAPTTDEKPQDDVTTNQVEKSPTTALYEALTSQLTAKDEQIKQLQQIILEKEANTTKLQDQFQQLLASQRLLAEPQKPIQHKPAVVVNDDVATSQPKTTQTKKPQSRRKSTTKQVKKPATNTVDKNPSPKKKPQPKKRWWQR